MGAIIVLIAPLVHMGFPSKTDSQTQLQEALDNKEELVQEEVVALREQYDSQKISAERFIEKNDLLSTKLEQQCSENAEILSKFVDERRIFGWKTPRKFLIALGIRLPYLILAILVSLLVSKINTTDKWLAKTFVAMQVGIYASAFYQLIWVFWTSQDYPLETYRLFALGLCLTAGVLVTFMFKYLKFSKISNVKGKIRYIMSLMIDRALENDHIKDEDRYEEEIIYPALKKLDE